MTQLIKNETARILVGTLALLALAACGDDSAPEPAKSPVKTKPKVEVPMDAGKMEQADSATKGTDGPVDEHTTKDPPPKDEPDASLTEPVEPAPVEDEEEQEVDSMDAGVVVVLEAEDSGVIAEPPLLHCIFSSPAEPAAPVVPDSGVALDVAVRDNAFVGDYLVNPAGKPLYIYTKDLPGDCGSPPVSVCYGNCATAWPPYFAGERRLAEGLDDDLFGTIVREDGSKQSTYDGWPIYLYAKDFKPETTDGFISGHGKGDTWMAARVNSYNVVVMVPESDSKGRYLATGEGRTLYQYEGDVAATDKKPPKSNCVGKCRGEYPPLRLQHVSPVGNLLPENFTVFERHEGKGTQIAYKGKPLYWSTSDSTRGEINGQKDGWSTVMP